MRFTTTGIPVLAPTVTAFAQSAAAQVDPNVGHISVYGCLALIAAAGIAGGIINTLMTDGKFRLPQVAGGVLCPGFIGNALIGGFASVISWSLYGAGAGIDLARQAGERQVVSLTMGALAGAALVGFAGAKWLTSEVDQKLLRATVTASADKIIPAQQRAVIATAPALEVFKAVEGLAPSA